MCQAQGPFFLRELFVNLLRGTEDPEEDLPQPLCCRSVLVLPDCDLVYPVKIGGGCFGEYEDSLFYFRGDSLKGARLEP